MLKLTSSIVEITQNPFNQDKVSPDLVNIATGVVMPADVAGWLEKDLCSSSSVQNNILAITVVDFTATIQSIPKSSEKSFGDFSTAIFEIVTKLKESNQIHIVPDPYFNQFIKYMERIEDVRLCYSKSSLIWKDFCRAILIRTGCLILLLLDKHIPTHLSPEQFILLALTDGTYIKAMSNGTEQAAEYNCDYEGAYTKLLLHRMSSNEHYWYDKITICCLDTNVTTLCC